MKKEPETVHKVVNGMKINITYTHNKDWDVIKKKLIKMLLDD